MFHTKITEESSFGWCGGNIMDRLLRWAVWRCISRPPNHPRHKEQQRWREESFIYLSFSYSSSSTRRVFVFAIPEVPFLRIYYFPDMLLIHSIQFNSIKILCFPPRKLLFVLFQQCKPSDSICFSWPLPFDDDGDDNIDYDDVNYTENRMNEWMMTKRHKLKFRGGILGRGRKPTAEMKGIGMRLIQVYESERVSSSLVLKEGVLTSRFQRWIQDHLLSIILSKLYPFCILKKTFQFIVLEKLKIK